MIKNLASGLLVFIFTTYLLSTAPVLEQSEVPIYVVTQGKTITLEEYNKQRKTSIVKHRVKIPEEFSQDQRQQVEKVHKILKSDYGKEVFRHAKCASRDYGVDLTLVMAIILTESGFDQYARNGNSHGLMQLSDNTTASKDCNSLYSIECNIKASTKHYAGLQAKYNGDDRLALAAYNAGGGSVDYALRSIGDIPQVTKNYVHKVDKYKKVIEVVLN